MPLTTGSRLGPYEIVAPLGAGGMGEVYRARDTRLNRDVAIKVLPAHLAGDPKLRQRFDSEARAVSRLNHPHIVTIHDIGSEQGTDFIVMEYVSGATLAASLPAKGLGMEAAVRLARQIAEAFAAAHAAGITHRDLKPANVMITEGDRAKVLDFGLAKLNQPPGLAEFSLTLDAATQPGVVLGTAAYMSPEQASGKGADARSDIFSFGLLLYEMLSGRRAFAGETAISTMAAILHTEPRSLREAAPAVPIALDRIVTRCLRKDPADRFQSMVDVIHALEDASSAPAAAAEKTAGANLPSIAVLPFVNMNHDEESEFLSDGISEDIMTALGKVAGLRVAPRASAFQFKGQNTEIRQVAGKLNVGSVLTGSVRRSGSRLRITVELIDAAKESQIWSERYDRVMEDIFDVQDEISRAIAETLKVKLTGASARRYTADSVAYELYLQGRHHMSKRTVESLTKAIGFLEQAIARDPHYALAHHAHGYCYLVLSHFLRPSRDWTPKALAGMRRACAEDGRLAEAHAGLAFARMSQLEWAEANKELQWAMELDSSSAEIWDTSALVLTAQGRTDEAITHIGRALAIEPLSLVFHHHAAWVLILGRRYDEAITRCRRAIELDPHFPLAHMWLAIACTLTQRFEEARREQQMPNADQGNLGLAHVCAASGDAEEARRLLCEFDASPAKASVDPYAVALVYAALGETDAAFDRLETAFLEGSTRLVLWGKCDPRLDPLRSDPRWRGLLERLGLA